MEYGNILRNIGIAGVTAAAGFWALSSYFPAGNRTNGVDRFYVLGSDGEDYVEGAPSVIVADDKNLTVFKLGEEGVLYTSTEELKRRELVNSAKLEKKALEEASQWANTEEEKRRSDFVGIRAELEKERLESLKKYRAELEKKRLESLKKK